jgi:hypothetical protein
MIGMHSRTKFIIRQPFAISTPMSFSKWGIEGEAFESNTSFTGTSKVKAVQPIFNKIFFECCSSVDQYKTGYVTP